MTKRYRENEKLIRSLLKKQIAKCAKTLNIPDMPSKINHATIINLMNIYDGPLADKQKLERYDALHRLAVIAKVQLDLETGWTDQDLLDAVQLLKKHNITVRTLKATIKT